MPRIEKKVFFLDKGGSPVEATLLLCLLMSGQLAVKSADIRSKRDLIGQKCNQ